MITLLNTSILTAFGSFTYTPINVAEARSLVKEREWQSAIGHESTAQILSSLLKTDVSMNRIKYEQKPGDAALIFKLKGRPEEGVILTCEEIEEIGYEFGLLERNS